MLMVSVPPPAAWKVDSPMDVPRIEPAAVGESGPKPADEPAAKPINVWLWVGWINRAAKALPNAEVGRVTSEKRKSDCSVALKVAGPPAVTLLVTVPLMFNWALIVTVADNNVPIELSNIGKNKLVASSVDNAPVVTEPVHVPALQE